MTYRQAITPDDLYSCLEKDAGVRKTVTNGILSAFLLGGIGSAGTGIVRHGKALGNAAAMMEKLEADGGTTRDIRIWSCRHGSHRIPSNAVGMGQKEEISKETGKAKKSVA